jgi:hypothetical protein
LALMPGLLRPLPTSMSAICGGEIRIASQALMRSSGL